jgi:D-alanyl-D-alanine carboxypeptidase (penicillin-binding protein 5/6)
VVPTDYDSSLIELSVEAPDEVEAPVREGDELGTITVTYDGTVIGKVPALAGQTAERDAGMTIRYRIGQFFSHPAVVVLIVLSVIALVLFVGYVILYNKKKRRKK